jgi:WD40 repeat protein
LDQTNTELNRRIRVSGQDNTNSLVDYTVGSEPNNWLFALPENRILSRGADGCLVLLNAQRAGVLSKTHCQGGEIIDLAIDKKASRAILVAEHEAPLLINIQDSRLETLPLAPTQDRFEAQRAAISPDGRIVAIVDETGVVSLWDTEHRGLIRRIEGNAIELSALEFAPDASLLLETDIGGRLTIRNVLTGELVAAAKVDSAIVSSHFSADGKQISWSAGGLQRYLSEQFSSDNTCLGW